MPRPSLSRSRQVCAGGYSGAAHTGDLGSETNEGEDKLTILPFEELAALFPDSGTRFFICSKICLDKGDHNEALEYAEAGLRVEPDYPDLVFNRSLALLETGKHKARH